MPRELAGLDFIARAQPIETNAYQRHLGVSAAVARRSLRKLRDLGLVNVHVLALELPSRYTLAPSGRAVLVEAIGRPDEELRVPRGIGKTNWAHHDGSVDLLVALERAAARSTHFTIEAFFFEDAIRREMGARRGVLIPDAVAILRGAAGSRLALAVEVDQGTEAARWVAERKGLPYAALRESGAPLKGCSEWLVGCVTVSEQRRNRLVAALWEANVPEGLWFLSTRAALTPETVMSSGWVTPRLREDGASAELVMESPFKSVITDCDNGRNRRAPRSASNLQ